MLFRARNMMQLFSHLKIFGLAGRYMLSSFKGQQFIFWGVGGGGVWFQKKNCTQHKWNEKILAGLSERINVAKLWIILQNIEKGKNILPTRFLGKISCWPEITHHPNTPHPPPSRVKWSAPHQNLNILHLPTRVKY